MASPFAQHSDALPPVATPGRSLTPRLVLLIGGLVLAVTLIYATAAYFEMRRAAYAIASDRLASLSAELVRGTAASRHQLALATQAIAAIPAVRLFLARPTPALRPAAESALRTAFAPNTQSLAVQLLDRDRRLLMGVAATGNWAGPLPADSLLRDAAATDSALVSPIVAMGDSVAFFLAVRVPGAGQPTGYVVHWHRFRVAGLDQVSRLLGARTDVYIGNKSGDVWTDFARPVRAPDADVAAAKGLLAYTRPGVGDVLSLNAPIPTLPWQLLVETSRDAVMARTRTFLFRLSVIGGIVLALGLLATTWLSEGLTRPLARLAAAAEHVADGDYTHHTGLPPRDDELGRLTESFDTMISRVQDAFASQRAAADAIRQSEEKYQTLIREAPTGITLSTLGGRLLAANPAFLEMLGLSSEAEALAVDTRELYQVPSARTELLQALNHSGRLDRTEVTLKRKDGSVITARCMIRLVDDPSSGEPRIEAISEDVTEQRKIERQFQQAQKMEAVGQLAGGIAHDFNNMLTVIISYSDLLLGVLDEDDAKRQDVLAIRSAGKSAAALTRQLLIFSRQQVIQPKVMHLNELVIDTGAMLNRLIGENIVLKTSLDPTAGAVKVDAGQMEQVIVNLAVNARDAMPEGGRLLIESKNVAFDEAFSDRNRLYPAGRYVTLVISDNGAGMSEEVQSRIFEPFYTTKEPGKGTGLGLATVYGIVKQSGGYISVYSELGKGTSFKIYFPRIDESSVTVEPVRTSGPIARGNERLLVVEDDEAVRKMVRVVLEHHGYDVITVDNGDAALAFAAAHPAPIDLLVTDVVMPGMSGRVLADRFAQVRPTSRILFVSGYTDDALVHQGVLEAGKHYLEKPFTPDALARTVRRVLDSALTEA